jgi:hypothetical protein
VSESTPETSGTDIFIFAWILISIVYWTIRAEENDGARGGSVCANIGRNQIKPVKRSVWTSIVVAIRLHGVDANSVITVIVVEFLI